jgi:diguanylate cyclase (GGDEF)-like protein
VASPSRHDPVRRISDPRRLAAVAEAELHGHLHDRDLTAVVETLRLSCRVPMAVINVVTEDLQTYPAEVGMDAPCSHVPDRLSFCAEVVEAGRPVAVADARAHPVYAENPLVRLGAIGAYAGVPLIDNGFILGSVAIFDDAAREFTAADREILRYQGQLASSVLALRRLARTDPLTGLANRAAFTDRVASAIAELDRRPGRVAVLYVDLDAFKTINDSHGHDVGDRVLQEVATRLEPLLRPTDMMSRLGGDEFAAVCTDLTGARDATLIAERMVKAVEEPWVHDGRRLDLALSVGVAVTAEATQPPAELVRAADAAMYRAKRTPGSRWETAHDPDEVGPRPSSRSAMRR